MAVDLIEFQRELWARLQKARAADAQGSRLGVMSGSKRWLLPLPESDSVLPLPPIAAIPAVQPWYAGLVNVRGNLYGVVDFALFQGEEATARNMNTRLIVMSQQRLKVNAALMVAQILGLQHLGKFTARRRAADAPAWLPAEYDDADGERWQELDLNALAANERFMKVAAIGAAA
jgi:twitching motility protein PilI